MSRCGFCETSVIRKQAIFCSGSCKNVFHGECANVPGELVSFLNSVAGLEWKCSNCRNIDSKNDKKKLNDLLEKHCNDLLQEFTAKFDRLKNEFLAESISKINIVASSAPSIQKQTYAQASSKPPVQKIIVKPKDPNQVSSVTKSDLMQVMNPINLDVQIDNIKHMRDGGVVLGCSEGISELQKLAEDELSSKYDVYRLKSVHPQIRIVGMSECYDNETLIHFLLKQNSDIFSANSKVNVIRSWSTKKKGNVFQALLQVDMHTFNLVASRGHVLIGFDSCTVFEALEIPRCFKCNKFFHTKKYCKNQVSCPICSLEHEVANCPDVNKHNCSNCSNLKQTLKIDLNTNHAAWNYDSCFAYKRAIDKLKSDLFGTPNK